MGLLNFVVDVAKEANDNVHGQRLVREVYSTFSTMDHLDRRTKLIIMSGYIEIIDRLYAMRDEWPRDGRIKVARAMQKQAAESLDVDVPGSYAKWLGGAWLESQERKSLKAREAYVLLESLAFSIRSKMT